MDLETLFLIVTTVAVGLLIYLLYGEDRSVHPADR